VLCAATREALECTAIVNPDGSLAVVVLNRSEHDIAFSLALDGTAHATDLPAHAIATYLRAA
jgi:glucosylceramidase